MKKSIGLCLALPVACSPVVLADTAEITASKQSITQKLDTLVISATRTEQALRDVSSALTVISAEDIAARKFYSVADMLRSVPGVDVVQSGGLGRTTSVFIRGAASEQTLVLIDGVEMNDPGSPGNGFDFSDLMVDSIERIEILRGPQSPLYGSNAIGGVINIITRKGAGKPAYSLSAEGGRYGSFKVGGQVSGASKRYRYNLSVNHLESDGFSIADARLAGNSEKDAYKNTTVNTSLGMTPMEDFDLDWNLRYSEGNADLDNCGGAYCDNVHKDSRNQQLNTILKGHLFLFDKFWEQSLSLAYTYNNRLNHDRAPGSFVPFSAFNGNRFKVNWQHNLYLHKTNTLTLGIEDEEDWMDTDSISRRSQNTTGYFIQDQIRLFDLSYTTLGVRFDDNNRFGGKVTWRVGQMFAIDALGLRLKGGYGTGFKAPSLFQLYAPADPFFGPVGNANLKPETSKGWDVGFEQTLWDERILFGASYFGNQFNNLIGFSDGYQNINSASSHGVETFFEINPLQGLVLRANYTYTQTRDDSTGQAQLRRPGNKASINANYRFLEKAMLNLNVIIVGKRDDMDFSTFPFNRVKLPGYTTVNLSGSYDINEYVQAFVRIDNVFDKQYQEVLGYGTTGVAAYGGFKLGYK